jgi:hypothetical protein
MERDGLNSQNVRNLEQGVIGSQNTRRFLKYFGFIYVL